jgi:integrase
MSKLITRGEHLTPHTFSLVAEKFLAYQKVRLRSGSYRKVARHIRLANPLHQLSLAAIDRQAITTLISGIQRSNGDVTANRVRTTLSHLFRWAMNEGFAAQNPVLAVSKLEEKTRDRVLENCELRAIWRNAGDDQFGTIIKLLILTGQPADNIINLRWSEIEPDRFVISGERAETGIAHIVPLSGPCLEVLTKELRRVSACGRQSEFVFGAGRPRRWRAKARLDYLIAREIGARLARWAVTTCVALLPTGWQKLAYGPT